MILTSVLLLLFLLEVGIDLRVAICSRNVAKRFKSPLLFAKVLIIPYLLSTNPLTLSFSGRFHSLTAQLLDFVVFYQDLYRSEPTNAGFEAAYDGIGHALLFLIITVIALEWYTLLLKGKKLDHKASLKKTRMVMIVSFSIYAPFWVICSFLAAAEVGVDTVRLIADISVVFAIYLLSIIKFNDRWRIYVFLLDVSPSQW